MEIGHNAIFSIGVIIINILLSVIVFILKIIINDLKKRLDELDKMEIDLLLLKQDHEFMR